MRAFLRELILAWVTPPGLAMPSRTAEEDGRATDLENIRVAQADIEARLQLLQELHTASSSHWARKARGR